MRQIKFRAWDPKKKRMIRFDHNDLEDYYLELDYWNDTELVTIEEKGGWQPYMDKQYIENAVLLQYTGLKDKNDKEIYEGDILETDLSRPYVVVVFRNGAFMYQCHDLGKDFYDYMAPAAKEARMDHFLEVIGNIYENPELLEQTS